MLSTTIKTISASLIRMTPHAACVRRPKRLAPIIIKSGAELKCSAPLGPLPQLAAARASLMST